MKNTQVILAAKIFHSLAGTWDIKRHIINNLQKDLNAYVTGNVIFYNNKDRANTLFYIEKVQVAWANKKLSKAFKQYKYILSGERLYQYNSIIIQDDIKFKKMYDLIFHYHNGILKAQGEYLCGSDLYKAIYEFESFEKFCLLYETKGKSKDFSTFSTFTKLS